MQRYVQTWSGDNYTSWETLKYNVRMGTELAVSGISNTGHDIGGFAGPKPEPELFLRWVQFGIFLPRFSIHSWNDDKTANEPWMYPEITPAIARLIKLRVALIPYLYDLLWRSHTAYEPMIRPTYYDFPDDPRCFEENTDMMVGASLLVAPVVEKGARQRRVYLPAGAGRYDFWTGAHHVGGEEIVVYAPWEQPPVFVREGTAIPVNFADAHFNDASDLRGFLVYPPKGEGAFVATCFEDDGVSEAYRDGAYGEWRLEVRTTATTVTISVSRAGQKPPTDRYLRLILPKTETRKVVVEGGKARIEDWPELDDPIVVELPSTQEVATT